MDVKRYNRNVRRVIFAILAIPVAMAALMAVSSMPTTTTTTTTTTDESPSVSTSERVGTKPAKPVYRIDGVRVSQTGYLAWQDTANTFGPNHPVTHSVAMILTDTEATCDDYGEMLYNARTLAQPQRDHIERALRWHPLGPGGLSQTDC